MTARCRTCGARFQAFLSMGSKMFTNRAFSHLVLVAAALAAPWLAHAADKAKAPDAKQLDRGRYLVRIAGCNDCHTPGYEEAAGNIPESQWLTGDRLGTRGPWGTTYPVNLRTYMQNLTEAQWVATARALKARPPMPWLTKARTALLSCSIAKGPCIRSAPENAWAAT